MRFFFDTEFIERGPEYPVALLSIGIVCETGATFYAETDADTSVASDWVKQNVLPQMKGVGEPRAAVAEAVRRFVQDHARGGKPEFWGYYADYDWVVLCQLFGAMIDLPKGWPMYCRDIKQWCDDLGNPRLPEQGKGEHNALADARWNKTAWDYLKGLADEAEPAVLVRLQQQEGDSDGEGPRTEGPRPEAGRHK